VNRQWQKLKKNLAMEFQSFFNTGAKQQAVKKGSSKTH